LGNGPVTADPLLDHASTRWLKEPATVRSLAWQAGVRRMRWMARACVRPRAARAATAAGACGGAGRAPAGRGRVEAQVGEHVEALVEDDEVAAGLRRVRPPRHGGINGAQPFAGAFAHPPSLGLTWPLARASRAGAAPWDSSHVHRATERARRVAGKARAADAAHAGRITSDSYGTRLGALLVLSARARAAGRTALASPSQP